MAATFTIDGVLHTTDVDQTTPATLEFLLNEHSRAVLACRPGFLPARLATVAITAQDGTTPLFGGVVFHRSVDGIAPQSTSSFTTIECLGYSVYLDWCYVSLTYAAATTLQTVLDDLVAALPAGYGITLDATDYTGTALAAFTWTTMRASDALRDLCARTGLAWRMSPAKVLSLFALPSGTAPETFTDAGPHALTVSWADPAAVPANTILLACGPTGSAWHTYAWTANGSASSWAMDIPAVGPGVSRTLLLVIGGSNVYATVDENGVSGWFTWDWTTATITVNTYPLTLPIPNGTAMSFEYLAQYPFVVRASTSATPEIQYLATDETITEPARGQEVADQMLATVGAQPRELQAASLTTGWAPGQALTVDLTGRGVDAVFAVTSVRMVLETDTVWRSAIAATEASAYTGSYLDEWRALTGGGGSSLVAIGGITGGGGGGTSASALSAHLGGSRSEMVISAAWTPIVHYQTYRCLTTGTYIFRTEAMTTDVGTSVSVRLYDVTASAVVTGGTVAASTATAWAESMLTVALLEGHRYRAELLGSNALAPVIVGQATVEPAVADAAVDYWAENRPAAGTARSLPTALFPTGNWWRQDISAVSLDARSTALCNFCAGGAPDLGGDPGLDLGLSTDWGNNYGFPYCTVSGNHPKIVFSHINYSGGASGDDERGYPIPLQALTEAGWTEDLAGTVSAPTWLNEADAFKDRHLLIYDVDNDYLYEIYQPFYNNSATPRNVEIDPGGGADLLYPYGTAVIPAYGFACASCSWWDAKTNNVRPDGVTSSDAAGLQVLPGLVNYDEIISGDPILHAHRLCLFSNSSDTPKYVWPATHEAGSWTANHPPLGTRFRLKASWNASGEYAVCQTFITALKTYGLIFVDRGGHGMISGTNDPRWGDSDDYPRLQLVDTISRIDFTDLEVVTLGWGEP